MRRLTLAVSFLLATTSFAAPRLLDHDFAGARHMILTPAAPLFAEERAELRAQGVEVQRPLTEGRFLARVARTADVAELHVEPLDADAKILRGARRQTGHGRTWIDVTVLFHDDVTFDDARAALLAAGGAMQDAFTTNFEIPQSLNVRIAPAALGALAADERVLVIGAQPRTPAIPLNLRAGQISHVPEVQAAPYNLSGAGQVVMVSEISEAQGSHIEYGGRVTTSGGGNDPQHSTHVTGTIAAQGLRADAKGMAPAVRVYEYNVGRSLSSMLRNLREQLPVIKAISQNMSLGFPKGWCETCTGSNGLPVWLDEEEEYGAYDAVSTKPFDDITNEQGTLLVLAAGNDGELPTLSFTGDHRHVDEDGDPIQDRVWCFSPNGSGTDCPITCSGGCEKEVHHGNRLPFDSLSIISAGKNVISVGAVQTLVTPPVSAGFSSRGPAKDGRVKPDLVARGLGVLSTVPTNSYGTSQGTSMAAPVVTGISVLVAEQWEKTFGRRAKPVELKAMLLAGATDLGHAGPDYTYGFGLVDAKNSVDLVIGDGGRGDQIATIPIQQNTQFERRINVTAAQNLKILATWYDPSVVLLGNDAITAKALVNDVDIRLIDPSGATHLPYVLDRVNFRDPATRGVNNVDNTEVIEIANAAPGSYRLIVAGTKITSGPVDVLVVSNAKGTNSLPCTDIQEPNDTAATAYGNLFSGQTVSGAVCAQNDADFIKFEATRFGPMTARLTSLGDTPLRVTLTAANGQTATVDVPAGQTREVTLQYGSGNGQAPALAATAKVEAAGTLGNDPKYSLTLTFGQFSPPRRRAVH